MRTLCTSIGHMIHIGVVAVCTARRTWFGLRLVSTNAQGATLAAKIGMHAILGMSV